MKASELLMGEAHRRKSPMPFTFLSEAARTWKRDDGQAHYHDSLGSAGGLFSTCRNSEWPRLRIPHLIALTNLLRGPPVADQSLRESRKRLLKPPIQREGGCFRREGEVLLGRIVLQSLKNLS